MRKPGPIDTPKGTRDGWTIYKYEGIPGLAFPRPAYWWATKDDRVLVADTRRDLLNKAAIADNPPMDDEHLARIAAALGF